ncbi:hypothetical protein HYW61_01045 [candidate division WWE3 bacterium]|nr:hypothetical protein [candidate division WWE3 bacterium]
MTKILQTNATNARKNLFSLMDQVVKGDVRVILSKEGTNAKVVLQKLSANYDVPNKNTQLDIVSGTAGSIKTGGYKDDEFEIAKKEFVKRYKKSNAAK